MKVKNFNGQMITVKDNATAAIVQNNGTSSKELRDIVEAIKRDSCQLSEEEARELTSSLSEVENAYAGTGSAMERLKACVSFIAPMFTIANGVPDLIGNIKDLLEFVSVNIR